MFRTDHNSNKMRAYTVGGHHRHISIGTSTARRVAWTNQSTCIQQWCKSACIQQWCTYPLPSTRAPPELVSGTNRHIIMRARTLGIRDTPGSHSHRCMQTSHTYINFNEKRTPAVLATETNPAHLNEQMYTIGNST